MTITSGLVKLDHSPCWGIGDAIRFTIAGVAVLR